MLASTCLLLLLLLLHMLLHLPPAATPKGAALGRPYYIF